MDINGKQLAHFLLARIAEDEAKATAAAQCQPAHDRGVEPVGQ